MIKAIAPGKMILLGEYAVLDGAPALVCAVNKFAVVSMEPLPGTEFRFNAPSLGLVELPFVVTPKGHVRFDPSLSPGMLKRLDLFSKIFEYTYGQLPERPNHGWLIDINTDDFYSQALHTKFGFGSSAALCSALVAAMAQAFGWNSNVGALFRLALNAHHFAQGKIGSGIDIAASYFGGYLIYQRVSPDDPPDKLPQKIEACEGLYFKPVFTGSSASTRTLVRGVNQLKEQSPDVYLEIMNRLKQISVQGSLHFKEQKTTDFLEDVLSFYQALKELGDRSGMPIISKTHQQIFDLARAEGVVYKPSGAGSGDIGILFSDDAQRLSKAEEKVRAAGYFPLEINVEEQGVRVSEE